MKDRKWQLCVCGVIRCKDEYLLIKRSAFDDNMPGFWEMPSGKVEFGETAEAALGREVEEEVGVEISGFTSIIIGTSEYSSEKKGLTRFSVQLNYLVEVPTKDLPIRLSSEHTEYTWVKKSDSRIDSFISRIIDSADGYEDLDGENMKVGTTKCKRRQ